MLRVVGVAASLAMAGAVAVDMSTQSAAMLSQYAKKLRTSQGLKMMSFADALLVSSQKDVKIAEQALKDFDAEHGDVAQHKKLKLNLRLAKEALEDMQQSETMVHSIIDKVDEVEQPKQQKEMDAMLSEPDMQSYFQMYGYGQAAPVSLGQQKESLQQKTASALKKSSEIDNLVHKHTLTAAQSWTKRERKMEHENGHGKAQVDFDWKPSLTRLLQEPITDLFRSFIAPAPSNAATHSKAVFGAVQTPSEAAAAKPDAKQPFLRRGPNWEKYTNKKK